MQYLVKSADKNLSHFFSHFYPSLEIVVTQDENLLTSFSLICHGASLQKKSTQDLLCWQQVFLFFIRPVHLFIYFCSVLLLSSLISVFLIIFSSNNLAFAAFVMAYSDLI